MDLSGKVGGEGQGGPAPHVGLSYCRHFSFLLGGVFKLFMILLKTNKPTNEQQINKKSFYVEMMKSSSEQRIMSNAILCT